MVEVERKSLKSNCDLRPDDTIAIAISRVSILVRTLTDSNGGCAKFYLILFSRIERVGGPLVRYAGFRLTPLFFFFFFFWFSVQRTAGKDISYVASVYYSSASIRSTLKISKTFNQAVYFCFDASQNVYVDDRCASTHARPIKVLSAKSQLHAHVLTRDKRPARFRQGRPMRHGYVADRDLQRVISRCIERPALRTHLDRLETRYLRANPALNV